MKRKKRPQAKSQSHPAKLDKMANCRKFLTGGTADRDLGVWLGALGVLEIDWQRRGKTKKECAKMLKAEFEKWADEAIQELLLPDRVTDEEDDEPGYLKGNLPR